MSIKVINSVWEDSRQNGSKLLCLLALADNARDDGYAFPSVSTIAKKTRMSERNVQRAIRELVDSGELEIEENGGPYGCNLYRVTPHGSPDDKLSGGGGDKLSGGVTGFDRICHRGGDTVVAEGVTTLSPEPSYNRQENRKEQEEGVKNLPVRKTEKSKAFVKPSVDEIIEYGATVNFPEDFCKAAFYYWEANGWMVGQNPMKSWKGALHTRKYNEKKWGLSKPRREDK